MSEPLLDAVRDLLWKATPFGSTHDGDTLAYLIPKGSVHRLVGVMVGQGYGASLRNPEGILAANDAVNKACERLTQARLDVEAAKLSAQMAIAAETGFHRWPSTIERASVAAGVSPETKDETETP